MSVLFQIIEKAGTIPWDELTLPEGRDKKSVRNMLDSKSSLKHTVMYRTPKESNRREGQAQEGA